MKSKQKSKDEMASKEQERKDVKQSIKQHESSIGQVQQSARTYQTIAQSFKSSPSFANAPPETKQKINQLINHISNAQTGQ